MVFQSGGIDLHPPQYVYKCLLFPSSLPPSSVFQTLPVWVIEVLGPSQVKQNAESWVVGPNLYTPDGPCSAHRAASSVTQLPAQHHALPGADSDRELSGEPRLTDSGRE